jgi:hypothetical protein
VPKELDQELKAALARAKSAKSANPMFFALVLKGGSDGVLIVGKNAIPSAKINEAKKSCGGTTVLKGLCFGEDGALIFETPKDPPGSAATATRRIAQDLTGVTISPVFRLGRDPDSMGQPANEGTEVQTEEGSKGGGPTKPVSLVALQKCRLAWDLARKKAQQDINALQKTILVKASGDPSLKVIVKVVKGFDAAKTRLDSSLVELLDAALNAPTPEKRVELYSQAAGQIRAYQAFVAADPLLKDIDNNPFLPVKVNSTLSAVLNQLANTLGG